MKLTTTIILIISVILSSNTAFAQDPGDSATSLTAAEAEAIALEYFPDTSVVLVEREFYDDKQLWDVKLDNGMAVYVDAQTAAIVELEPWQGEWEGIDLANFVLPVQDVEPFDAGDNGIDFVEAEAIALRYYPNAVMVALELDDEDEFFAWDVILNNGMAVYIHAETGDVLEFEMWSGEWRDSSDDGTPPWAGFPGGRRAWVAQQVAATPVDTTESTATSITAVEAQQIALQLFPNTTVTDIDRDVEYGIPVWDIDLSNGVSIEIAIAGGTIVEVSDARQEWENSVFDNAPSSSASSQPSSSSDITSAQAQQIALAQFPGTTVVDIETDTEYGVPVWDVELSNGVSIDISRIDGTIIEIYYDDDRWEDDDDWDGSSDQSGDDNWSDDDNWDDSDDWEDDDDDDDWDDDDWDDDGDYDDDDWD